MDPDGDIVAYSWDLGDGNNSSQANPSHAYAGAGTYTVTLTVTDNEGASNVDSTTATVTDETTPPPILPDVSINSTSQNAKPGIEVAEQPLAGNSGYKIFGTNDLGMHCGDFDTRISSILPPFNVLHAQVIRRGGEPNILTPADGVEVIYSAASNPSDPILSGLNSAGTSDTISSMLADGSVYKTNFWDSVLASYSAFYPPGVLEAFAPIPGQGLPMPNVEQLYLGDGDLTAEQQSMPGISAPYMDNIPQPFTLFTTDQPFFTTFPFGYVAENVNWYEAAGIPLTAFDDFGRENPWPLYRVQAKAGDTLLASTDVVVPISGEANCGACHNDPEDDGNGAATERLYKNDIPIALALHDTANVPHEVSKEWAADLNLIRLHDLKHGSGNPSPKYTPDLEDQTPVVCQSCHYTPALDLAQVGPKGPENDVPPYSLDPSNGRNQLIAKSMSNVMHSHHGTVTDLDGNRMFPEMPAAIKNEDGLVTNQDARRQALNETCYQCHPGRRTDCLRGAMANGGMLCQDCHGDMAQVGDDFSKDVSPTNVGGFILTGNFYNPEDNQPRVPWANEPGCGSCHTGDAMNNMAGADSTIINNVDAYGNTDGIRLFQAYTDGKATPIVPSNKRFAENVVTEGPASGNPMLYRVSKGHAEVYCEACHGATHGIWPNKNPAANDNVTATQLQGHTGTITECSTCHVPSVFEDSGELELTMNGPHGMHPVGSRHWNTHHKEARQNGGDNCRTCHGRDGEGTVLSRMATDRTLECKDEKGDFCSSEGRKLFPKGHVVGCDDCHSNDL